MQIKDRNYARVTHPTNVAQHENAIYDIIWLQNRVLMLKSWFKDPVLMFIVIILIIRHTRACRGTTDERLNLTRTR